MYDYLLIRYLHFLGLFIWVGALVAELVVLQPELDRPRRRRLVMIDRVYGASAVLAVGMGLLMWFVVGKPATYYDGNAIFYLKISLAGLVGLISLYPTVWFARQHKSEVELVTTPQLIPRLIMVQLGFMAVIPLLASLMAAGVGK